MNLTEAVEALESAATAAYLSRDPLTAGPFLALCVAAREEDFAYGDPRRALADSGEYLLRRAGRKPVGSVAHTAVTHLLSGVLFRVAHNVEALRIGDADMCPCVVVRLWHPALAVARAVLGTDQSEGCKAHEEAMR